MNILLIDDDWKSRNCLARFIRDAGHFVAECGDGQEALKQFSTIKFQLLLSDVRIPGMSGIELLQIVHSMPKNSQCDVVLFARRRDAEMEIAALRAGAYDFLLKPIDPAELSAVLKRVAKQFDDAATIKNRSGLETLPPQAKEKLGIAHLCAVSKSMKQIVDKAHKYHQDRSIPILIEGETGTGKEVIARLIHYGTMTESRPFIAINCAALTSSLFESELFGYEAGAFTGGLQRGHKGKFDIANGGTLFLDEIGEIPLALQAKLLRVIEEKEFYRVGGLKKVVIDVRIICATNIDLKKSMAAGTFRKDLYYRLGVGHLDLPPLRNRQADIVPIAEMFLQEFAQQRGKRFKRISHTTQELLTAYSWPGNIREIRNVIEWATFMYDDVELKPAYLPNLNNSLVTTTDTKKETAVNEINPENFVLPGEGFDLDAFTDRIIAKSIALHKGNKSAAARFLGITRRALCCRLERLNETNRN